MSGATRRHGLCPSQWLGMALATAVGAMLAVLLVQFGYETWFADASVCRGLIVRQEDGQVLVVTPACVLPTAPAWLVALATAVGAAASAAAALFLTRRPDLRAEQGARRGGEAT